jgi:hypothetical protein
MNSRRLMGFIPLAENHHRKNLIRPLSESYPPNRRQFGAIRTQPRNLLLRRTAWWAWEAMGLMWKVNGGTGQCGATNRRQYFTESELNKLISATPDGQDSGPDWCARLGQRHLFPEFVQVRGYNRPSQGLRPLWRVEPDLERDRDSRQHATQHNNPERGHCPWPFGAALAQQRVRAVHLGAKARGHRGGPKLASRQTRNPPSQICEYFSCI